MVIKIAVECVEPRNSARFTSLSVCCVPSLAASLFPVASLLQRKTVDDIHRLIVTDEAKAMIRTAGIDHSVIDIAPLLTDDNAVHALLPVPGGLPTPFDTISSRGYPSFEPDLAMRRMYWVPLIRRTNAW